MLLLIVPHLVNDGTAFPLAPRELHAAAVEGSLGSGCHHSCFRDGHPSVQRECLALLLFARVDGKRKRRVDGGVEFSHVVVDFGLADRRIGGANMRNELAERDRVETFGGVIEPRIVDVVDGGGKLIACDGGHDKIRVPRFAFGDVRAVDLVNVEVVRLAMWALMESMMVLAVLLSDTLPSVVRPAKQLLEAYPLGWR